MKTIILNSLFWGFGGIFLLALDFISKFASVKYLSGPITVVPGLLQLRVQYNPGIAFSIPVPNSVVMVLTPVLLALVVWLIASMCDMQKFAAKLSLVLIIIGGMGNFLNRLWTSSVIDMISFSFWPTFNLADAYLTIGTFIVLIFYGKISLSKYGAGKSN